MPWARHYAWGSRLNPSGRANGKSMQVCSCWSSCFLCPRGSIQTMELRKDGMQILAITFGGELFSCFLWPIHPFARELNIEPEAKGSSSAGVSAVSSWWAWWTLIPVAEVIFLPTPWGLRVVKNDQAHYRNVEMCSFCVTTRKADLCYSAVWWVAKECMCPCALLGTSSQGAVSPTHRTVHSSVFSGWSILSPNPSTFYLALVRMRSDIIKRKRKSQQWILESNELSWGFWSCHLNSSQQFMSFCFVYSGFKLCSVITDLFAWCFEVI